MPAHRQIARPPANLAGQRTHRSSSSDNGHPAACRPRITHAKRYRTGTPVHLAPAGETVPRRAESICADCNEPITNCSSQSVIVSCRRPIARRITELSGHAAGLASPRSSLRATDRLWEAARCRRTSGRWRARLRLTAHAVRRPPGGLAVWRSCCLCWPRRDGGSCCGRSRSGPASARSPSCSGRAIYHSIARGPSVFRGSLVGRRAAGIRIQAGGAQAGAGHGAVAEILRGGDHKLMPGPAVARRHPGAG